MFKVRVTASAALCKFKLPLTLRLNSYEAAMRSTVVK
jgi:hypothetical protein